MSSKEKKKTLAWHETLEIHELTAFQANHLMGFKMMLPEVADPALKTLYSHTIAALEHNLKDLLGFYPLAPSYTRKAGQEDLTAFQAGHLLGFWKNAVRSYANSITEAATPQVRETMRKHLNAAIEMHAKAFNFMLERGLYPAYDLPKLLENDVKTAQKAIAL
ncbi:spore coat protein [Paenibacillus terreus]|uniref:Spore coat protein n=1 Tax=Paenibacillus terreus TaxID=1387834 RepID=A0ABV5B6V3_9BACL